MKVAAILTSHVMESICRLPGVPTHDWCDRAAAALSRIHHPSAVVCTLGRIDPRGFVTNVELVGVAASDGRQAIAAPQADTMLKAAPQGARPDQSSWPALASETQLNQVKSNLLPGEWLGWNLGTLNENLWFVSTATQQGLMTGRGPGPLSKRWDWLNPTDILLGAVNVLGGSAGRMLFVELATNDPGFRESGREQAVLAACLPMLSKRVCNAFGTETEDRMTWLTPREEVVMWHLVAGLKVPQIAELLHRSIYTVHDHVKSLHRKLNANNRGQLVARALGHLGPIDAGVQATMHDADPACTPEANETTPTAQRTTAPGATRIAAER